MCIQYDGKVAWTQHGCQKTTSNNNGCCNTCWNARRKLFRLFENEFAYRRDGVPPKMNLMLLRYQSPSIIGPILEENSYQMGIMKKQINYRDQKIDRLFNKLDKVDVACNWDYLFNLKELGKLYDNLCSKEEVMEKEVMDYLFRKCMAVHGQNKVKGNAKGHRYSTLLI